MNYQDLVNAFQKNGVTAAEVDQYLAKAKVDASDVELKMVGAIAASIIKDRSGALSSAVTATTTTAGRKPSRKDTALAKRETKAQKDLAVAEAKQAKALTEVDRLRAELKDASEAISIEIADIKENREDAARVEVGSQESIAHRVTAEIAEFVAVESQVAEKVKAFKDQYRQLVKTANTEIRVDITPSSSEFEQFDFFAPL